MTTTKTKPSAAQDQVDAAQKDLDAALAEERVAQAEMTALRELNEASGNVTTDEYVRAGAELQRAEDKRKGREKILAEAQAAVQLEGIAAVRGDIENRADPARAAAAYKQVVDGLTALAMEVGPPRRAMVTDWTGQLRKFGVDPKASYDQEPPVPEKGGFLTHLAAGGGQVEAISWPAGDGKRRSVHASPNLSVILASAAQLAGIKAGASASLFGIGGADQLLTQNPDEWFKVHN